MDKFKDFILKAIEFAFDLYTVVGGITLLLIIYGFLWFLVSIVWSYVHKPSHTYFENKVISLFVGKDKERDTISSVDTSK